MSRRQIQLPRNGGIPRVSHAPSAGFTLVELLVVISIIALLMALLLPSLQRAKQHAEVVTCLTNIRQFYIACAAYSNDGKDFPHTLKMTVKLQDSGNYDPVTNPYPYMISGEHAAYQTGGAFDFARGVWAYKPIRLLLLDGGYVRSEKALQCTAKPAGGQVSMFTYGGYMTWSGNYNEAPMYCYIGPSAIADGAGGYGHTTGLFYFGKMRSMGNVMAGTDLSTFPEDYFGASVKNRFMRAMATCPSLQSVLQSPAWAQEPHYGQERCAEGNANQDGEMWTLRRRNYLYNDGHAQFVKMDSHP